MFQRGALRSGRYLGEVRFLLLVFGSLFIWCCGGRGFSFFTYSDEVE